MKLIEYVKNAVQWLCVGIVFLVFIWGWASLWNGRTMEGFICLAIVFVPIIILLFVSDLRRNRGNKKRIEWLKRNGLPIEVDFSFCHVIGGGGTVNYTHMDVPALSTDREMQRYKSSLGEGRHNLRSQAYNALDAKLFPDIAHQQKSYEEHISFVVFSTKINGRRCTFYSEPLMMDKVSLDVQLALQEKGVIYVNPKNKQEYYFDLEFL